MAMATNPQLKDYIAQQTKVGVSKDVIKNALIEAGWEESDINQAIEEASSSSPAMVSSAVVSTIQPQAVKLSETFQASRPLEPATQATKPSHVSFVASDIFRQKGESVFQPAGTSIKSNIPDVKPAAVISGMKDKLINKDKMLPIVSLGVLSAVFLAGNIYLFFQNSSLNSRIGDLSKNSSSLEKQVASLTNDRKSLAEQVNSLSETVADYASQLSIFALPSGTSTGAIPFAVSGTLGGGGKSLYILTTSGNILLLVKNSKDVNVDAALKPLIGTKVKLDGTHQSGANQLTVTAVNDQPVQVVPKVSTTTIP